MHEKTLKTIEKNCQILLDSSCQNFESVFLCSPLRLPYLICALVKGKPGVSSTEIIKTLDIGANSFRQIARILVEKNVLRSVLNGVTKHYYSEKPINAYLLKIQNQIIYENKSLQEAGNKFDAYGKKTAFLKRNKTSVLAIKAIRNKMVIADYKKGEKTDYICQKYSFSSLNLRRILLENNIKITDKSNPKYLFNDLEKIKSICLDIKAKIPMRTISNKYNLYTATLYSHLYRFGLCKSDFNKIRAYSEDSEVIEFIDNLVALKATKEKDIEPLDFEEIKNKIIYQNLTINDMVTRHQSYNKIYVFLKDNETTVQQLKTERNDLIFTDYKLGISSEEIIKKYSISLSVFSRILLAKDVNRKEQREKERLCNNPEKIKLICLDINNGKTLNQITSKYKLSNPVIYSHLHKFGLSKEDIKNIRENLSESEVVDLCDRRSQG